MVKITTLQMISKNLVIKGGGLYFAYNKSILEEVSVKFTKNIMCKIKHGLVFEVYAGNISKN